jgi:hypothetical protein
VKYLKWDRDIIGLINEDMSLSFRAPDYNETVSLYTRGKKEWTREQFTEFLSERIVSRERRDIEKILFRCGLSSYDVLRIARITRAVHPRDLFWIAGDESETLEKIITGVFDSVFHHHIDLSGDTIDSPEGCNVKRYGVFRGKYGIYKQRLNPLVTDRESEIAVYLLGQRLGVSCCPAFPADGDSVFSEFLFDFSKEYIVHFRRLFDGPRSKNEYQNLIGVRPQYGGEIAKMIILDFITRQDDRHLSNIAVKISGGEESFYPLYDNGRSLFYEDTEEMTANAVKDPAAQATTFGYSGSYWDYVQEIARNRGGLKDLIDTGIKKDETATLLGQAGLSGYRFEGALEWITKTIDMVRAV